MALLEARHIRRQYPGVLALDDVSLGIEAGSVHVLAGENGAGKSTLIRTLTGVSAPDSGSIAIDGRDALADRGLFGLVAYVPQELNLFAHMSVAENLFMPFGRSGLGGASFSPAALDRAARPYLDRFGIHARPGQAAGSIGVSDQQLLQIARASTRQGFRVLILDEPTSSLTASETGRLFALIRQMRDAGHAIVFVSHKMEEMFEIGDSVTVLRNGRSVGHHRMDAIDERGLIRLMSGDEMRLDRGFQPKQAANGAASAAPILEVRGLGGRGASGRGFADVSFSLRRGEILGFAGLVGAGRSELMQTVFGILKPTSGTVTLDGRPLRPGRPDLSVGRGMIYLSEERKLHGILPLLSVRENIGISLLRQTAPRGVISGRTETLLAHEVIARYGIRTPDAEQKIRFLSGGNQQKVIIGRAMAQRPRLLIFDEPTKGIDIRTKGEIYAIMQQLAEEGVGIILVSSDLTELRRCATRIATLYHGRLTGLFETAGTDAQTLVAAIIGAGPRHAA